MEGNNSNDSVNLAVNLGEGAVASLEHGSVPVKPAIQFPATKIVHWPSGPVATCDHHARALAVLANMLGCHVGVSAAPDDAQCDNCINSAAKSGVNLNEPQAT